MKKKLCIGLISPSPILISLLDSIGVWYEEIDFNKSLDNYCQLIIDGEFPSNKEEIQLIQDFSVAQGSVLEISTNPTFYSITVNKTSVKTVFNTISDTAFDRISHLDIYSNCALSSASTLFSGLVDFQKKVDHSTIGFIGLDLRALPPSKDYIRKRFLSSFGIQPDEMVNKVSRDALCDLIELTIQKLLHDKDLPFVKKWTSPKPKPIFGFRIDSDYGTKESLQEIYSLLNKHTIPATWFLHVKAHENWLEYFKSLKGQEFALHGYKHGSSNTDQKISSNIEAGLSKLKKADIETKGFCAPYGIWNNGLEKVIGTYDFLYTSEFTTGYDCVPFHQEKISNLQIPIHPICTGSLSRKRYSNANIQRYFMDTYQRKEKLFKPILFYHHPLQIALNIFDEIFAQVNSDKLTKLTFGEYAEFWNRRHKLEFTAFVENDQIDIESNDPSLLLYISSSSNSFDLIPSKNQSISKDIKATFKYETPSLPSQEELKNLHRNRFELMKTSFIDWKNRNYL